MECRWCGMVPIPVRNIGPRWALDENRVELSGEEFVRRTGEPMTLSLPPFTKGVTWLIGINTAVFLLMEVMQMARMPLVAYVAYYCALVPADVVQHGFIWQLLTYSFIHSGFAHWFWNMI